MRLETVQHRTPALPPVSLELESTRDGESKKTDYGALEKFDFISNRTADVV